MRFLLIIFLAALASCAASADHGPRPRYVATHADSTLTAAGLPSVGKLVFRGPVTIQVAGPGSNQTSSQADNRKAGQRQGSAATGAGAASGNESKHTAGGTPWWVYLVVAVVGAAGWELFSTKVAPVRALLRWRLS